MNRYFEDPAYLWLLLLVPVLAAFWFLMRQRQKSKCDHRWYENP